MNRAEEWDDGYVLIWCDHCRWHEHHPDEETAEQAWLDHMLNTHPDD